MQEHPAASNCDCIVCFPAITYLKIVEAEEEEEDE